MARELFYEESATCARARGEAKLYMAFHVTSIIFFVLAAIHLSFSFTYIGGLVTSSKETGSFGWFSLILWISLFLSLAGAGVGFFFLKRRFNVSYDYTFVEDELRVTKVFNGKRRKYLVTMKADQMLKIGWEERDSFRRTVSGLGGKKPQYLTSNREPMEDKTFIYILYSTSMGKVLYVLECREMLLEYVVRAAGITKLERQ